MKLILLFTMMIFTKVQAYVPVPDCTYAVYGLNCNYESCYNSRNCGIRQAVDWHFNGVLHDYGQNIEDWNTSQVTDMSRLFADKSSFNSDISKWNTSQVTTLEYMFAQAKVFNQPLNDWDTSKVTNMRAMFTVAEAFNQPLNNWDTSQVTNMYTMFAQAKVFNQPLKDWDTSQVTNMRGVFAYASKFDGAVNDWDTSQVTTMANMFTNAKVFNQPLNNWDTSQVTTMANMFWDAKVFNQPLNNWNTSQVTTMANMFTGDQYGDKTEFNQDISKWDTSKVTTFEDIFAYSEFSKRICVRQSLDYSVKPSNYWNIGCTCEQFYGGTNAEKSCMAGTDHLKDDLTTYCSYSNGPDGCNYENSGSSACCDPNPTCDYIDGDGADFASCVAGTNHLKDDLTNTCGTDTCTASDCCDPNPTCGNVDGNGADFACVSGYQLKDDLTNTCATDTCTASECCNPKPCTVDFSTSNSISGGANTDSGDTFPFQCQPGYGRTGAVKCTLGSWSNESCVQCGYGQYSSGTEACQQCPSGTLSFPGQSSCDYLLGDAGAALTYCPTDNVLLGGACHTCSVTKAAYQDATCSCSN